MSAPPTAELETLEDDPAATRLGRMGGRVFDAVKQAIVQLRFRPGNLLSEADVARQLGVSRQPVREAFIKLAESGLVEVRPQRGTFVRLISVREVENARFLREAIEVAIVRKAVGEAKAEELIGMEDLIGRQRVMAAAGDTAGFLRLDEKFHQAIAASADCDDAWRVLEGLKAQMDRVRYLSLPEATPLETIIAQHIDIVDAIKARSAADAEAAMRRHLSEILISLPKLANEHPAFFAR
jgi:DNA-binding GntR family transcriptional regulator